MFLIWVDCPILLACWRQAEPKLCARYSLTMTRSGEYGEVELVPRRDVVMAFAAISNDPVLSRIARVRSSDDEWSGDDVLTEAV